MNESTTLTGGHELLAGLRAAGAEPIPDEDLIRNAGYQALPPVATTWESRLVADLLEARAKLAKVRGWAEDAAVAAGTTLGDTAAWILDLLDREVVP